jgi:hypothetical protein
MTVALGSIALLALAGTAFAISYWKLCFHRANARIDPNWLLDFSADRYAILGRMLAGNDYDWVLRETEGDKRLCRRLRSRRRKAFRRYLAELSRDFTRLQVISGMIVVGSRHDESELAKFLFRQTVLFRFRLLGVHVRLALNPFHPGNIDVSRLLDPVRSAHCRLFWLAAAQRRPSTL